MFAFTFFIVSVCAVRYDVDKFYVFPRARGLQLHLLSVLGGIWREGGGLPKEDGVGKGFVGLSVIMAAQAGEADPSEREARTVLKASGESGIQNKARVIDSSISYVYIFLLELLHVGLLQSRRLEGAEIDVDEIGCFDR